MMKGRLRSAIFERAMAGDTTLLIFLAKTILGLRESKESPDVSVNVNAAASVAPVVLTPIAERQRRNPAMYSGSFESYAHAFGRRAIVAGM